MLNKIKIIYFGSSTFSKIVLETIYQSGVRPALTVTKPDTKKGRGLKLLPTQVSSFAQKYKLNLIKPENLTTGDFRQKINQINPDYLVVADYGKIIPEFLLQKPKKMPLGVHPSLLPNYRGASPITQSLMQGKKATGITIFSLNQEVDAGPIILQEKIKITPSDDYLSLRKKLACLGASVLLKSLIKIEKNQILPQPQDSCKVTYAPKLTKKDGLIDWLKPAETIENLVKAAINWPTAYTYRQGKTIKITRAKAICQPASLPPATVLETKKDGIYLATGKGILQIISLKPEGKKEMPAWNFVCGNKVAKGEIFAKNNR